MLVSLYSSKGGAGKSTAVITILGAVAEYNRNNPDDQIRALGVDADRQGTLTNFANERRDLERPTYGVEFVHVSMSELGPRALIDLSSQYDVTVVDLPGFYDEDGLRMVLASDVVLVPTNLGVGELNEAYAAMNNLTRLKTSLKLSTKHARFCRK